MSEQKWIPLKDVLEVLTGDWQWPRNSRCKYIDIPDTIDRFIARHGYSKKGEPIEAQPNNITSQ